MKDSRVRGEKIAVNVARIHDFYAKRAVEKGGIHVDAPVVLCGDEAPEKITAWTDYEVSERLPLLELTGNSRVLEWGFGTGRITKHILETASHYVGVDYVEDFVTLAKGREDIRRTEHTHFLCGSFEDLAEGRLELPQGVLFDRFVIAGGVMMYINDDVLKKCLAKLPALLAPSAILYISEPIAMEKRLTLNQFYSDELAAEYSAIYRTREEYDRLFAPLYAAEFQMVRSEEFFVEDIKARQETKQWLFLLRRN